MKRITVIITLIALVMMNSEVVYAKATNNKLSSFINGIIRGGTLDDEDIVDDERIYIDGDDDGYITFKAPQTGKGKFHWRVEENPMKTTGRKLKLKTSYLKKVAEEVGGDLLVTCEKTVRKKRVRIKQYRVIIRNLENLRGEDLELEFIS